MDMQSEIYDKLLCKKKGPLTVSDGQLPVSSKWDNVGFSFPPIPIQPFPFSLRPNKLA